jgi:hypothetical protein
VHAGGQFVDEKFAVGEFKEFDAEKADQFELIGNLGSKGEGGSSGCGGSAGREYGAFENACMMTVLEGGECDRMARGMAGD